MEITERIESCINELDARREKMASLEARIRAIISTLSVPGEDSGPLGEALGMLEGVLRKYGEIDLNCRRMIEGLREIGQHLDRIENGRQKIVEGVEKILGHLSQLDEMASKGLMLGPPHTAEPGKKPKRVLVIRIRPEEGGAAAGGLKEGVEESGEDGLLDAGDGDDFIVH